ncbi:response regulator receiver domain-containing protein [Flavobacterium chryseum]|uniref:response regulator n=1 Tax=Flavobacterium sp. P3160 TaxID=2512113 RepID=UPI00105C7DDA|nr:response regulator [Flavobacterium sp. P3160]TDO73141.1 response regulator receiver domain-containing protein [Flavobacterium sp. P3160]
MLYKNILLIDDDSDDADVFIEAINSLEKNISCLAETNPVKALEFLESTEILPDLIFLDYNMPVLNGNEFIEKIRAVKKLEPIRVIVYSSYSETAAEQLSIIHDTETYITKPNTFTELTAVLKTILD